MQSSNQRSCTSSGASSRTHLFRLPSPEHSGRSVPFPSQSHHRLVMLVDVCQENICRLFDSIWPGGWASPELCAQSSVWPWVPLRGVSYPHAACVAYTVFGFVEKWRAPAGGHGTLSFRRVRRHVAVMAMPSHIRRWSLSSALLCVVLLVRAPRGFQRVRSL